MFKLPLDVSLRYGLITQAAGLLGTLICALAIDHVGRYFANPGGDETGVDHRHRDARALELDAQRIEESRHRVLGGAVAGARGHAGAAREARDPDDAPLRFAQVGQGVVRAIDGPHVVHLHDVREDRHVLDILEPRPHDPRRSLERIAALAGLHLPELLHHVRAVPERREERE